MLVASLPPPGMDDIFIIGRTLELWITQWIEGVYFFYIPNGK